MATKYCDHGAYGAYAAVPTWGAAQDGDGTTTTVGTPSTAEIVFTGVPSSGSIYVLGVVVSPTWATSADNCANLLATAINALTTTAVGPASFTTKSQVRNHLYARGPAAGAPSGTCQIMTRQASASHAGLVAVTHTLNNVSSAGTVNFTGGAGGCWGYLSNTTATIWPSAVTIGSYGLWHNTLPYCGTVDAGDVVEVASGKTISYSATGLTISVAALGSSSDPVVFNIDDGTVWPAYGVNPVLKFTGTMNQGYSLGVGTASTAYVHFSAKEYSDGAKNLVFENTSVGTAFLTLSVGQATKYENIEFRNENSTAVSPILLKNLAANGFGGKWTSYVGCKFVWDGRNIVFYASHAHYSHRLYLADCEFAPVLSQTPITGFFILTLRNRIFLDRCKFTGFTAGSRLIASGSALTTDAAIFARDCEWGGMDTFGPNYLSSMTTDFDAGSSGVFTVSHTGRREFSLDRPGRVYAEWNAAKGRPTLSAKLLDGVTPWSMYVVPSNTTNVGRLTPVEAPCISKLLPTNAQLTQAARTITVHFLVPSTVTLTLADISARILYTDSAGERQVIETYDIDAGALGAGSAGWSSTSWGSITWVPQSISVTTPTAALSESTLDVYVKLHLGAANETLGVIIDPEVLIA